MSRRERHGGLPDPSTLTVEHVCRPPRWMVRSLIVLALVLLGAVVGLGVGAFYVYQQQQYIEGRGHARDLEDQRTNDRINDRFCDLLALAPADSPQADYYRAELNCPQPGVATDELPPAIRQRYEAPVPSAPVAPAASSSVPLTPVPPLGSAASPYAPDPVPTTPGSPPTTEPSPSPDPLVDLGPITKPLCDALGVCL